MTKTKKKTLSAAIFVIYHGKWHLKSALLLVVLAFVVTHLF